MLRRRPLNAAVVKTATSLRRSSSSQLWVQFFWGVSSASRTHISVDGTTALSVPLELTQGALSGGANTAAPSAGPVGPYHRSGLHVSRVLLAPRAATLRGGSSNSDAAAEDLRGPYDVTIDEVLLHDNHSSDTAVDTVADLVRLLVDPDLEVGGGAVEAVSLRDFVVMTPKRKLKAVGGDTECLNVLMGSERYQGEKDARELRMHGVATVGHWKENSDRIALSAYARGLLDAVYNRLARHRQQSQKDEVVAWLTRTIQRAVADELMAPKRLSDGTSTAALPAPPLMDLKKSAVTAAGPASMDSAATPRARSVPQRTPPATAVGRYDSGEEPAVEEDAEKVLEEVLDGDVEFEDEEMERLMAEAEAVLGRNTASSTSETEEKPAKHSPASTSPSAAPAGRHSNKRLPRVVPKAAEQQPQQPRHQHHQPPPLPHKQEVEADGAEDGDEEFIEEVEEVAEEEEEEVVSVPRPERPSAASRSSAPAPSTEPAPPPVAPAVATTAAAAAAAADRKERLIRLSELMLRQFNTADGYLHPTSKAEREAHEKQGYIVVLDEDTAQVDPLAMFSAYHAAVVTDDDPVGVRALKTIWTSYNKHQMALEEATDEAAIEFYKRQSVDALLYGSVLMRSLAREEQVVVLEGTPLPPYGFPLVSSDTQPFTSARTSSPSNAVAVTDMTPSKVVGALQAYKTFFTSKEKRYSPFRPGVDRSEGCSVVCLSGTTLHLYHTSTKDHIIEEEVRLPFAEVMLGVLHLFRNKALPRVNVVHYHLIATRIADPSDNTDFMLRSTATIDLTNPFSKEELTRLRALAAPLGMADEMEEYRCIDDFVIDIEETSGASVVHSLLHNREDLEATLTATLAQLLPEDGDGTDSVAEVEEQVKVAPTPPHASKTVNVAATPARSPTPRRPHRQPAVQEEEGENVVEMDAERQAAETTPPARALRGAKKRPSVTTVPPPTTRRAVHAPVKPLQTAATTHAARDRQSQEEAEFERAIYSQLQQQQSEEEGEEMEEEEGGEGEEEVEEEEGEEGEEDVDDNAGLPPARAPARASVSPTPAAAASPVTSAARALRSSKAPAATALDEEDEMAGVDDDEEMEVVAEPSISRASAGRRAVPVAATPTRPRPPPPTQPPRRTTQQVDDADEEAPQVRMRRGVRRTTARVRAPLPAPLDNYTATTQTVVEHSPEVSAATNGEEDQWFRRRPKRRYFE